MPMKKTSGRATPRGTQPQNVTPIRSIKARDAGVINVIDFDAELSSARAARPTKRFRFAGYDYTFGQGPNPWALDGITDDPNFNLLEFIASYFIPKDQKRFIKAVKDGDYNNADVQLLQTRIMEASTDRPTAAS